jgi:hypothetical protein
MSSPLPNKIGYDTDVDESDLEMSMSINDGLTEPEESVLSQLNPLRDAVEDAAEAIEDVTHSVEDAVEDAVAAAQNVVENVVETVVEKAVADVKDKVQQIIPPSVTKHIKHAQQGLQLLSELKSTPKSSIFSKLSANLTEQVKGTEVGSGIKKINELVQQLDIPQVAIDIPSLSTPAAIQQPQAETGTSDMPPANIKTTRNRKLDRRNLANDILAELPIAIRFNEGMFLDNDEHLDNYTCDWDLWASQRESNQADQLKVLIEQIACDELKYKSMASTNSLYAKVIQVSLMILGSAIVYIQAKGSSPEVVNDFNIASGAATTIASILLQYCNFTKKAPHYSKIQRNLQLLRSWIDNKLVLPISKRFSPFDIFIISRKAYDTIILEAKNGLENTK